MHNKTIKLGVLSSYCWIDPGYKESCNLPSLTEHADFDPITLKQIPPIKRRRLSGLSKLAMHTSLNCIEQAVSSSEECLSVFASQHGELNRTVSIVDSMFQEHEVSPKDFSLSVHNASLGLFSIFTKNKQAGTSIAAGPDTFGYALLESYNLLQRFPEKQVLLTCFDLEVSHPLSELQKKLYPSYSLSLLLTSPNAAPSSIGLSFEPQSNLQVPELPMALAFYDFLHIKDSSIAITTDDTSWKFIKNV